MIGHRTPPPPRSKPGTERAGHGACRKMAGEQDGEAEAEAGAEAARAPDMEAEAGVEAARAPDAEDDHEDGEAEDTAMRDARCAAEELLQGAQLRIECAKVLPASQLAELVVASRQAIGRAKRAQAPAALARLLPQAAADRAALLAQWQQRSGVIRVLVRVRPPRPPEKGSARTPPEPAVQVPPGSRRDISVSISAPSGRAAERAAEVHRFRRFDRVLGPQEGQDDVFREVQAMLPARSGGGFGGPPQAVKSECLLSLLLLLLLLFCYYYYYQYQFFITIISIHIIDIIIIIIIIIIR